MKEQDRPNEVAPAIAIPRVLWWFRLWPFWRAYFEALGWRVVTNDPGRPTPRHRDRSSTIVEEACYPIQLLIDRTLAVADSADAVFLPRLISVDPRGIMCPRFAGVPDIVRMVLGDGQNHRPVRLLTPVIDMRDGSRAVRNAYVEAATSLGASPADARRAYRLAAGVQERFEERLEQRLNRLPLDQVFDMKKPVSTRGRRQPAFRVAVLGHPYVAYDWEFNLGAIEKLRALGAWVTPVESVALRKIEKQVKRLDKNVYWSSGRDILGAAMHFFQEGETDGVIYFTCFKCGVDGLLSDVLKWAARRQEVVSYLPLMFDGHDNEMGLTTRLEAFADIVRGRAARAAGAS